MPESTLNSVPVAPGRLPAIGHLVSVAPKPLEFLVNLRKSGPIVRVDLGPMRFYFITSPDLHRQALTTKAHGFTRGRIYERARALFGDGLATSTGSHHLRQRRMVQPLFHRERIGGYAEGMSARVAGAIGEWKHGQIIHLDRVMHELMLEIVVGALISREVSSDAATEIHRLMPVIMKGIPVRMMTPSLVDGWRFPPSNRRFDDASHRLRQLVGELIAEYRADQTRADNNDLLGLLVAAQTADPSPVNVGEKSEVCPESGANGMTDEQICDEVVSLLMAGTETPSSTLAWLFFELAQHPEVEAKLHEEIDRVMGTGPVSFENFSKLEYADRVLTEALRLHPTLLFTLRTTEAVTLGDIDFPAGVELAYSPYALHRDPELYPNPESFDPNRWLGAESTRLKAAFAPFNLGSHKCIGEGFAWAEMMITMVTIVRQWKLSLAEDVKVRAIPAIVPRPNTLPMVLSRR